MLLRNILMAAFFVLPIFTACSQKETPKASAPVGEVAGTLAATGTAHKPHVVLIALDTVRPDWLECYGHPWVKTPTLAAFADEAVVFDDTQVPATTTLASHTSIFTGTYPHTHGAPRNGFTVSDANIMLPEVLKENGYATAGFIGAFPLDPRFNFNQGFDHYDYEYAAKQTRLAAGAVAERSAAQVNKAVAAYLEKAKLDVPQFLFVHYFDAHAPYLPPKKFLDLYNEQPDDEGFPFAQVHSSMRRVVGNLSNTEAPRLRHRYAAEISYLDHHLGELFAMLREHNLYEDSIILVTSDHGETLWDHDPYFDHGMTVYQAEARMVGLLRLPGAEHGGTRSSLLVSGVDWMPTVLSTLGIAVPDVVEGRAIDLGNVTALDPARFLFAEATKPHERVERGTAWLNERKARAVRLGHLKYIRTPYQGTEELYDLKVDPLERNNLLLGGQEIDADLLATMKAALEAWSEMKPVSGVKDIRDEDEDTRQKLESLGYF